MSKIDYEIPVYETKHFKYIRISDLKPEDRGQLERWIFGQACPLIQGKEGALLDCVFLEDYIRYNRGENSPLTIEEKRAILEASRTVEL